jgi:hypothetical protein
MATKTELLAELDDLDDSNDLSMDNSKAEIQEALVAAGSSVPSPRRPSSAARPLSLGGMMAPR